MEEQIKKISKIHHMAPEPHALQYKVLLFYIYKWVMLTSALRVLVNNLVKESFYGKRKKKTINVLTVFFIFHKSDVKTFLKWILNQCSKGTH